MTYYFVPQWLTLAAWCSVFAGATVVPIESLEAAESRRPQGWFKGIGFGGFRFGVDEEDASEEAEGGQDEESDAAQLSYTEEQVQQQAPKKGQKYGISQQRGGLVSAAEEGEVQTNSQGGEGGKKHGSQRGQGKQGQNQKGDGQNKKSPSGEGQNQEEGAQNGQVGGEKNQGWEGQSHRGPNQRGNNSKRQNVDRAGAKSAKNQGNINQDGGNQEEIAQGRKSQGVMRGRSNNNNQEEQAAKKDEGTAKAFRDFYFGQREAQQGAIRGHSRSQFESQQGYAIVEDISEDEKDVTDVAKDEAATEEAAAQDGAGEQNSSQEEAVNQEGEDAQQGFKDFYSGVRGQQQSGFRGHSRAQQKAGKQIAFSAIRQASYFPAPSSNRDQDRRSDSNANSNNKEGNRKVAEGWSFQYVLPVKY